MINEIGNCESSENNINPSNQDPQIRLTKDFIPLHYEISLDIDIINLSYISKVEITIESQIDNPKYLSLNSKSYSKESKISNYKLISENDHYNYIIKYLSFCPEDYTPTISSIYFSLKDGIKKGDKLIFKCEKNDKIKTSTEGFGLYISFWNYKLRKLLDKKIFKNNIASSFKDKTNPTLKEIQDNFDYFKSLVISLNSSPVGLREIFPCFDEPSFKATYKFTISVNKNFANSSKNFTIVNNSDIEKIIEKDNTKTYIFKKIPKISCYLLTFTIGYYEYIEKYITKINKEKLRLRVYGPENQIHKVDYCLTVTEESLKKYEKIMDIPLYIDKIDSIFIPNLNFSAMEFLGCITYKQEMMIDKNNTTAVMTRINIKDVYHEVFHNWIGNLVTMEFFDNTWLNEGITKFIENFMTLKKGKGYLYDIFRMSYYYTLSFRNHALTNKEIDSEESIWYNFDNITYEKGGYIMNMLVSYFGKEKIYEGLKLYCNKFKYGCTNEKDFFDCMSKACDYDIKKFLKNWVYKISYPILDVVFSENKDEIIIEQRPNCNNKNDIFEIPIFLKTKNLEKVIMITEKTLNIKLDDLNITYEDINNKNNFIVINSDIKCFCVVNYSEEILKNAIFDFYNKYNEKQTLDINKNEHINKVSDADIYQIIIYNQIVSFNETKLKNNIKQLKKIKNFEILYFIIHIFINKRKKENKFFLKEINLNNKKINKEINSLVYEVIDYNNTDLINKILEKFDNPTNIKEEDESGQIEYEKFFITIICIFKRDENIVKKIYEIFKKNNFNLYQINKTYRIYLPLILIEFMYLFPENEKIMIYKSIAHYYEEMYYNFYFLEKEDFEYALNILNDGMPYDVLDYFFDNFEDIYIEYNCKVDSIIIDYFFKYIKKLYDESKHSEIIFQDYLYEVFINKSLESDNSKIKNIYKCYLLFIGNHSIDADKLYTYLNDKYLHLNELKDNTKIEALKDYLLNN